MTYLFMYDSLGNEFDSSILDYRTNIKYTAKKIDPHSRPNIILGRYIRK